MGAPTWKAASSTRTTRRMSSMDSPCSAYITHQHTDGSVPHVTYMLEQLPQQGGRWEVDRTVVQWQKGLEAGFYRDLSTTDPQHIERGWIRLSNHAPPLPCPTFHCISSTLRRDVQLSSGTG